MSGQTDTPALFWMCIYIYLYIQIEIVYIYTLYIYIFKYICIPLYFCAHASLYISHTLYTHTHTHSMGDVFDRAHPRCAGCDPVFILSHCSGSHVPDTPQVLEGEEFPLRKHIGFACRQQSTPLHAFTPRFSHVLLSYTVTLAVLVWGVTATDVLS